jgi:acyl-CoA synthetase (AMP-forming)/AMP-acid ligase II
MKVNEINLGTLFSRTAKTYGGKTAIIFNDKRISFDELNRRINSLSNALTGLGIRKNDKVATLFFNTPEFLETYFAIVKIGGVVVPLNFRLVAEELSYMLNDSKAKVLFYGKDFQGVINNICSSNSISISHYICEESEAENTLSYEELIGRNSDEEPNIDVSLEDPCAILYTAGTTGFPKGAVRTHYNICWDLLPHNSFLNFDHKSILLATPPMFHIAGMEVAALPGLMFGGTVIPVPAFNPEEMFQLIEKEKATHVFIVPAMAVAIKANVDVDSFDTSSLKEWMTASAPLPGEIRDWIFNKFPHVRLTNAYGMTETGTISALLPYDIGRKDATCVGKPNITVGVRVVDTNDKDVSVGELGEIVVRAPMVINEYYNLPKQTAESTTSGYFHTGDVGKFDEEGFLYIADRKKDMILTGGENVYAAEVENILFKHPKILEAALIGIPDPKWGEVVTAVVVPKQNEKIEPEEIIGFCRKYLAGYKCPKKVYFLDELPKNTFGKVLKRNLREKYGNSK